MEAENKNEMIKILAELNDCKEADIIECLGYMGVSVIQEKKEKKVYDAETIISYLKLNTNNSAIARELGVTREAVRGWRKKYFQALTV